MIKIEHPNLQKIAQEYFTQVKEKCKRRAGFYKKIIEVLFGHAAHVDLKNYKLNGKSKVALTNVFLNANKLTNQNHYANVVIGNCYPWVAVNRAIFEAIADYLDNDANLEKLILCMPDQAILSETDIENHVGITIANRAEIYESHLDVVGELIVKCDSLSDAHARSLGGFFNLLHTNEAEFYRFYFGNYFHEKDFHRRPLAKLSKDIIRKTLPHFAKEI